MPSVRRVELGPRRKTQYLRKAGSSVAVPAPEGTTRTYVNLQGEGLGGGVES